jgi:hypothetical protein
VRALAICAGGFAWRESRAGADRTVDRKPAANARTAATVIMIFLRLMLISIRNQIRASATGIHTRIDERHRITGRRRILGREGAQDRAATEVAGESARRFQAVKRSVNATG